MLILKDIFLMLFLSLKKAFIFIHQIHHHRVLIGNRMKKSNNETSMIIRIVVCVVVVSIAIKKKKNNARQGSENENDAESKKFQMKKIQ